MKNKEKTHYQILGIKKSATIGEIKVAYRKRIAKTHPDKNTDSDHDNEAWRINLAYHTLKDPKRRAEYDRKLVAESLLNQTIAGVRLSDVADNLDSFVHRTAYNAKVVGRQFAENFRQFKKVQDTPTPPPEPTSAPPIVLRVMAWQAMLGERVEIDLNGSRLALSLPQGVQTGALLKVGLPTGESVLVRVEITNPADSLTDEQRQAWQALKAVYEK